jgi:hypothetical protein
MSPNRKFNEYGLHSARQRWITFLFIALLTILMYLIGKSMIRHHFMGGGRDHQMMRIVPAP